MKNDVSMLLKLNIYAIGTLFCAVRTKRCSSVHRHSLLHPFLVQLSLYGQPMHFLPLRFAFIMYPTARAIAITIITNMIISAINPPLNKQILTKIPKNAIIKHKQEEAVILTPL